MLHINLNNYNHLPLFFVPCPKAASLIKEVIYSDVIEMPTYLAAFSTAPCGKLRSTLGKSYLLIMAYTNDF
jgi:hypothetical protein